MRPSQLQVDQNWVLQNNYSIWAGVSTLPFPLTSPLIVIYKGDVPSQLLTCVPWCGYYPDLFVQFLVVYPQSSFLPPESSVWPNDTYNVQIQGVCLISEGLWKIWPKTKEIEVEKQERRPEPQEIRLERWGIEIEEQETRPEGQEIRLERWILNRSWETRIEWQEIRLERWGIEIEKQETRPEGQEIRLERWILNRSWETRIEWQEIRLERWGIEIEKQESTRPSGISQSDWVDQYIYMYI